MQKQFFDELLIYCPYDQEIRSIPNGSVDDTTSHIDQAREGLYRFQIVLLNSN
jgi:hypothetical protein